MVFFEKGKNFIPNPHKSLDNFNFGAVLDLVFHLKQTTGYAPKTDHEILASAFTGNSEFVNHLVSKLNNYYHFDEEEDVT